LEVQFFPFVLLTMTIAATSSLWPPSAAGNNSVPERLAIYYGYPSLVNGSGGDVQRAASVFAGYDAVVLGDGLEFADKQPGRYPEGDPAEHQKAQQIIGTIQKRNPATRIYGYVCLGEIPWPKGKQTALSAKELQERIQLWKQMGVYGIFLDEAGYDYPVVTRERQNLAVRMIHEAGLSAFMNAYFVEHLFSLENKLPNTNGSEKNPNRLAPLLDRRDLFLLESFQIKNGDYEDAAAAEERLSKALKYRRQYGTRIFATTTTTEARQFSAEKFNYAWWTARLYGLDGLSWGEPYFAAANNSLPNRRCAGESTPAIRFEPSSTVNSDANLIWRQSGSLVVVVNASDHSVRRMSSTGSPLAQSAKSLLSSTATQFPLTCNGASE
jgi:hypothetical protein